MKCLENGLDVVPPLNMKKSTKRVLKKDQQGEEQGEEQEGCVPSEYSYGFLAFVFQWPLLDQMLAWMPVLSDRKLLWKTALSVAMGQNPLPPVNIPIATKIGSKLGGEFTYPKMVPKRF